MIQVNELRIGDWALNKHGEYTCIECDDIVDAWHMPELYNPIPLTPEILEKAGFDCYGVYPDGVSSYIKKGVEIHLPYFEFCYSDSDYKTEIKYLHQLQNLYFALTGEELQIDL